MQMARERILSEEQGKDTVLVVLASKKNVTSVGGAISRVLGRVRRCQGHQDP